MLAVGEKAPDFELMDQTGKKHRLGDYAGKWVVLYFYPKDDTPGCTKEACAFRDSYVDLKKQGVVVLGVSKDTVTSHDKFAKKYALPFPLLADEEKHVIKAYEAWGVKKFMGREFEGTLRVSYLIDPMGKIHKAYAKVKPATHAQKILADLRVF